MAKIAKVVNKEGYFLFDCPGCGNSHYINTNPKYGATWNFNGDLDNPTVSPSILVRYPSFKEFKRDPELDVIIGVGDTAYNHVCHSFITDGKIQFLSDCTHELANHTVELPEI